LVQSKISIKLVTPVNVYSLKLISEVWFPNPVIVTLSKLDIVIGNWPSIFILFANI